MCHIQGNNGKLLSRAVLAVGEDTMHTTQDRAVPCQLQILRRDSRGAQSLGCDAGTSIRGQLHDAYLGPAFPQRIRIPPTRRCNGAAGPKILMAGPQQLAQFYQGAERKHGWIRAHREAAGPGLNGKAASRNAGNMLSMQGMTGACSSVGFRRLGVI